LRRGVRFVSLDELVRRLNSGPDEEPRIAAVTFDDGWTDQYDHALPVLERLRVPATFFVTTEHLRHGREIPGKMGRDVIQSLARQGVAIGSHTRTHPHLPGVDEDAKLFDEVRGSKQDLEDLLGKPVTLFAYPGGAFNARVARAVRFAGYEAACSCLGPARNDATSLYWLYRGVLSDSMRTLRDRYLLSAFLPDALAFMVRRRLRMMLHGR
jgi:peptidoglycan/xylan/chitin deacetylase (PgdA/CDA1 family)